MESRLPKTNAPTPKTKETTSNEAGIQPLRLSHSSRSLPRSENPSELPNTASIPENETSLIINDLSAKTHETTGNEAGIQPLRLSHSSRSLPRSENPSDLPKNEPLPENETSLIINDLDPKTPETTGNKAENPTPPKTPTPPKDNLIRQGEVFSRPVYVTPTWPFREEPRGNKFKY